jgi:hypothetical protein
MWMAFFEKDTMLINDSMDLLFLQYYIASVVVHVSVVPGEKKSYFQYSYSYADKVYLYSNTRFDLFIRACKIHASVRKCFSPSYVFCGHLKKMND